MEISIKKIKKKMAEKSVTLDWEKPLLRGYPHHALMCGIYQNSRYDFPITLSSYIQLVYDRNIDRIDYSIGLDILSYLKNIPLLYCNAIGREFVADHWKCFTDFLREMLDAGYYVHYLIDTYYVAAYENNYQKIHIYHNITIFGYDEKRGTFETADSYVHGKFKRVTVTETELENGFFRSPVNDWLDGILLYKRKEDPYVGIGYDIGHMREQASAYLDGSKAGILTLYENRRRANGNFVYGMDIYGQLREYLKEMDINGNEVDMRLFYILKEHKYLMAWLTKELYKLGQIQNGDAIYVGFRELETLLNQCCSNLLKYNLLRNNVYLQRVDKKLWEIEKQDRECMTLFLESIQEQYGTENTCLYGMEGSYCVAIDEENEKKKYLFYGNAVNLYGSTEGDKICTVAVDGINSQIEADAEGMVSFEQTKLHMGYHILQFDARIKVEKIVILPLRIRKDKERDSLDIESKDKVISNPDTVQEGGEISYLGTDRKTAGNWQHVYGIDGYDIIGNERKLPDYMSECGYRFQNAIYILIQRQNGNSSALHRSFHKEERTVAYYLNGTEFGVDITVAGDKKQKVSFYCVDYDQLCRKMRVELLDGSTNELLHQEIVEHFESGVYLRFAIKGHMIVKFICLEGPDAVLSGVFFG